MEQQKIIIITLEEYKELLMIKGKYEELKEQQKILTYPKTTFRGNDKNELKPPYKVTC